MKIYMSTSQAQRLAEFLKRKKKLRALELDREYYWRDMAGEIDMTEETLRRLKDGKGGMNLDTLILLSRAFGAEVLDVLGIEYGESGKFGS